MLFQERVAEGLGSLWEGVTDNKMRMWRVCILLRKQIIGHFSAHATKAYEAGALATGSQTGQVVEASHRSTHDDRLRRTVKGGQSPILSGVGRVSRLPVPALPESRLPKLVA
jgi:hypothetical protein